MAGRRGHNQWKRIGSGTTGARKAKPKVERVKRTTIDREAMAAALADMDAAAAAEVARRKRAVAEGASVPKIATGSCHECGRDVSGERRYCGTCLAGRL